MSFELNDSPFTYSDSGAPLGNDPLEVSLSFSLTGLITGSAGEIPYVDSTAANFAYDSDLSYSGATNTLACINLSSTNITSSTLATLASLKFAGATTVDTIETTLTDDDTHLPTSGAVYDAVGAVSTASAQISPTPSNHQVAVWTNGTTIEGDNTLTFDSSLGAFDIGKASTAGNVTLSFKMYNSVSAYEDYGAIKVVPTDTVATQEDGNMYFYIAVGSALANNMTLAEAGLYVQNTLFVDTITEVTPDTGVTIDGVELKDDGITLGTGATVDNIETDISDDDTHIATSGAIVDYVRYRDGVTTVNAATYDLLVTDYILHVTYTGTGAVTSLTLPTAQCTSGRLIHIKDAGGNASVNNITVDTEGAETIDGAATAVINGDYDAITLYSSGSNWYII